jgi:hypothetical protein
MRRHIDFLFAETARRAGLQVLLIEHAYFSTTNATSPPRGSVGPGRPVGRLYLLIGRREVTNSQYRRQRCLLGRRLRREAGPKKAGPENSSAAVQR